MDHKLRTFIAKAKEGVMNLLSPTIWYWQYCLQCELIIEEEIQFAKQLNIEKANWISIEFQFAKQLNIKKGKLNLAEEIQFVLLMQL